MRLRVPVLLTATLTAALVATSAAVAVAAPTGATPVTPHPGDVLAMTAVTTPTAAHHPEGSRVLLGNHVYASSRSPRDITVGAQDVVADQLNGIRVTAPIGKRLRADASGGYDVAATADATHVAVSAIWDGYFTCNAVSGLVRVVRVVYGTDRRVAGFAASYTLDCGNGTRIFGSVEVGLDAPSLTVDTFATAPNVTDLGAVPIGVTRRVTVTVTYHGRPGAGQVSLPVGPAAGDATLIANGCSQPGIGDGRQCLVVVDVTPHVAGNRAFAFGFGDRGGRFAVVYTTAAA